MLEWHRIIVLVVFASSLLRAQLTIENPKHLDAPEQKAQALFLTTNRVMEAEFHSPGLLENRFHMRLVLGQTPERFTVDDPQGNGSLYLERWDEGKFALATMRLAVQHLLAPERQQRMLQEIRRRTNQIAPVQASQLRHEPAAPVPPALAIQDKCLDEITNAALRVTDCHPSAGLSHK